MEKQRGATPHTRRRGMLTLEQLRVEVSEGNIDTVVVAFTDMQGRLQGKLLAAESSSTTWWAASSRAATTCSRWTWR